MEGARVAAKASSRRTARTKSIMREYVEAIVLAILLTVVIRGLVVQAFKIPTGSMENTLLVGDFLLVNKLVYGAEVPFTRERLPGLRRPRHGDIMVFDWPVDPTKNFVKRVIGLPGDTVQMKDAVLVRNG